VFGVCVRWYAAYALRLRHIEEMMAERGVFGDHTTVHRAGQVTLPPLARPALDRYLVQRGLPTTAQKWRPDTPRVGNIGGESCINRARLWVVMKRFFATVADVLVEDNPSFVEKLHRATPQWPPCSVFSFRSLASLLLRFGSSA
jgi:hypothetical protein